MKFSNEHSSCDRTTSRGFRHCDLEQQTIKRAFEEEGYRLVVGMPTGATVQIEQDSIGGAFHCFSDDNERVLPCMVEYSEHYKTIHLFPERLDD